MNGMKAGVLTGFFSGLLLDFLSAAPLGMNAFIRTVIGGLSGRIRGGVMMDVVFLPVGLCAGATLAKALLLTFLHFLFAGDVPNYSWTGATLWLELAMNVVAAPFLFDFLKNFASLLLRPDLAGE
jgi:rod shape-determining protein MreD